MEIVFLTTGGTIDKVYFDARSTYEVGRSTIDEILGDGQAGFDYQVKALLSKDSLDLTAADRQQIREAIEADSRERFVVTHGTDTMVETARYLMGLPGKVVVLTGALAPSRFRSSDAAFNVGMSVAAVQTLPPGVYVAMNGQVFPADDVRKNSEHNRFEALATR